MSNPSLSDPATTPDPSVNASEQAQPPTPENAQGSATLDAQIAAGESQPQGEPVGHPIATNFAAATTTGDPKTAGVSGEMGAFSADQSAAEKGSVNLQNNPDVPGDRNNLQEDLPDTDPIPLPNDPTMNLPT